MSRVFDFSSSSFQQPYSINGIRYRAPSLNELTVSISSPSALSETSAAWSRLYSSTRNYQHSLASQLLGGSSSSSSSGGLVNGGGVGVFSSLDTQSFISSGVAENDYTFMHSATIVSAEYKIRNTIKGQTCESNFFSDLTALPSTEYVSSVYLNLVRQYGTHVVVSASYGKKLIKIKI